MRLEEHPTPRTDSQVGFGLTSHYGPSNSRDLYIEEDGPFVHAAFARDLERRLQAIHALVEGDADGTIDATPYEKLCNEIAGLTGIKL